MKIGPVAIFPILMLLAGCAATEPVYLKDAAGRTAQCGPYTKLLGNVPSEDEAAEMQVRMCVSTFERGGYERVASPN